MPRCFSVISSCKIITALWLGLYGGGYALAETFLLKELFEKNALSCRYTGGNLEHQFCESNRADYELEVYLQGVYTNVQRRRDEKPGANCVEPVDEFLQIKQLYEKVHFAFSRYCDVEYSQNYEVMGVADSHGGEHCQAAIHEAARRSILPGLNDERFHFVTISECFYGKNISLPLAPVNINPGFDCAKSSTKIEKAICSNSNIAYYDSLLTSLYYKLKTTISKTEKLENLKQSQREWVRDRNVSCKNYTDISLHSCLVQAYYYRVSSLSKSYWMGTYNK